MRGLEERAVRAGARRAERIANEIAEAARGEAPEDVRVTREGRDVVLSGRGLRARALDDARLRGFTMLAGRRG